MRSTATIIAAGVATALVAALLVVAAGTASASTPAHAGYTLVTVTSRDAATLNLTHTAALPGTERTPCCLTNRINRVTLSRYNSIGMRMWTLWEEYRTGSRAGWVWTAQRYCGGSGSAVFDYNGCSHGPHWGHLGYTFVGGRIDAVFSGTIAVPYTGIKQHNYPHISMTVYGNGKVTYNRECGC